MKKKICVYASVLSFCVTVSANASLITEEYISKITQIDGTPVGVEIFSVGDTFSWTITYDNESLNFKSRNGEGIVTNYTASSNYYAYNTDAQFSFDPKIDSLFSRFVDPNPTIHYSAYWSTTSLNIQNNFQAATILEPNYYFSNVFSLESGKLMGMTIKTNSQDGSLYKIPDSANSFQFSTKQTQTVTPTPEPATMLLFGTGIAGLIGSRIKRKRL